MMQERKVMIWIGVLSAAVPLAVAALLIFHEELHLDLGSGTRVLPAFHALLNGTTAVLLALGLQFIKSGRELAHRRVMLAAFGLSAVFLLSYVVSKLSNPPVPYGGEGMWRTLYFFILISHILLSVPLLPLAMLAIWRGWTNRRDLHKKVVKWAWPVWMYVAITGVLVFLLMSPYYPS
jgi:putative membrane protein